MGSSLLAGFGLFHLSGNTCKNSVQLVVPCPSAHTAFCVQFVASELFRRVCGVSSTARGGPTIHFVSRMPLAGDPEKNRNARPWDWSVL